ncbi:MAG: YihY family inner membrane protein [Phycisphaeraceae bacterium]|nr:YihY family inner membrane protein [Phycisphaeraceae bacterium]
MRLPAFLGRLSKWFFGESTWAGRLRYLYDFTRHCIGELRHDSADQMAASLTYRTIFSLVPMFVLALIVFRGFGGFDTQKAAQDLQGRILAWSGLSSITYDENDHSPDTPAATHSATSPELTAPVSTHPAAHPSLDTAEEKKGAREGVQIILSRLTDQVSNVSLKSIGAIGLVLFIWAAIGLAISLESSFNTIYNAPRGRPWHLRVTIYWAAITLGPVLLFVSLYLSQKFNLTVESLRSTSTLSSSSGTDSNSFIVYVGAVLTTALKLLSRCTALLASWLLLFLLYRLMPNTKVRWRPALMGSFVAAILWEAGKVLFQLYVRKAVPYSAIYGSLGLVPLFLFWIYITWLIVLFGLVLSYTLQVMKSGNFKYAAAHAQHDHFYDPRWLIPMMGVIGRAFVDGRTVTREQVAHDLTLPARVVAGLAESLEGAGLIHSTQLRGDGDVGYVLAMPPEKIPVTRLLDLSRTIAMQTQVDEQSSADRNKIPGWSLLDDLSMAQQVKAGDATLANLL